MNSPPDDFGYNPDRTSLFVVSLPRSLSSHVYQVAARMLGLRCPLWTSSGEILNIDRMAAFLGGRNGAGAKFTHPLRNPLLFDQLSEFLDHVTQPTGYAYKDVIQPMVVARWPRLRNFKVLRINRPLADVAYAMLHKGWHYPTAASLNLLTSTHPNDRSARSRFLRRAKDPPLEVLVIDLVEGLVRARNYLDQIPATTIEFDDLLRNPRALVDALESLYPDIEFRMGAVNVGDTLRKLQVYQRRETPAYREIDQVVHECEARIATA